MPDNSAPDMSGIDPALLQDFISESQEILDGLDPLFVALESNPDDMSIVDGIFRPVHSVKGNSGFFGLTNIKNFAHIMENILGEIRARKRTATPPLIDLLLKGVDFLRGMMNRLAQGDYSGQFTAEEESHLALLNAASSESGGGSDAPDSPEGAAAKAMETIAALNGGGEVSAETAAAVEDAVKHLIRLTLPDFFASQQTEGGPVAVGYMLGPEEVTGYVTTVEQFIKNLEKNEKEEALCESFLAAIQTIEDIGEKHEPEVVGLVEQIKDDFITIHESGIGFDELMTSLIQERFDAILKHIKKVEIGGDGDFFLGGENVTDTVNEMQGFIAKIVELEKDSGPSDGFVANIDRLKTLAGDKEELLHVIDQIRDDFLTIHDSGIGFDELMQSLMEERFTAILAQLDRGAAVRYVFKLGDADVSEVAKVLEKIAADPSRLTDEKTRDAFIHGLQTLGEAAEAAGKAEVGTDAAGLVADVENILKSEVGLDPHMESMITERLHKMSEHIEKVALEPEPEAAAETSGPTAGDTMVMAGGGDTQIMSGADTQIMAPAKAAPAGGKPAQELSGKTLRVAEEKVDSFMSFVGELIITGEVFAYIQKKLEQYPEVRQVAQEFKNANLSFGELSTNLQKSLMEVRRVPLKSVLQKLHRIVRDTSAALGKKIDFEIEGEDVQIDKSLLEGLESPLVHMVRNSVDHGVETPEDRVAAGKSETGHVLIKATATEEQFSLAIIDDGKGLDLEAIKSKAISRGLLTEEGARMMPDKDAFRLIFNAGLSTAKVVTDVSGRGVGMDVVLSNITKMNGNINVDSQLGKGSTFTILLPMTVTLTVIDGLVARIGDQFYIIPLSDVRESVKPSEEQVHIIKGSQEVLNVRGELHPIVRLSQILGIYSENVIDDITQATAVLVQGKRGKSAAFLVDELIGQQSVVVKDLGKEFEHIRCLSGGSILGDGRIGLVLSVQGVLEDIGLAQPEA